MPCTNMDQRSVILVVCTKILSFTLSLQLYGIIYDLHVFWWWVDNISFNNATQDCPFNTQQRNGRHTKVDLGNGRISLINIHKIWHAQPSSCVVWPQRSNCCSWLMACSIVRAGGFHQLALGCVISTSTSISLELVTCITYIEPCIER